MPVLSCAPPTVNAFWMTAGSVAVRIGLAVALARSAWFMMDDAPATTVLVLPVLRSESSAL